MNTSTLFEVNSIQCVTMHVWHRAVSTGTIEIFVWNFWFWIELSIAIFANISLSIYQCCAQGVWHTTTWERCSKSNVDVVCVYKWPNSFQNGRPFGSSSKTESHRRIFCCRKETLIWTVIKIMNTIHCKNIKRCVQHLKDNEKVIKSA